MLGANPIIGSTYIGKYWKFNLRLYGRIYLIRYITIMAKRQKNQKISVEDREITIRQINDQDYISLNDMAGKGEVASRIIYNWLQTISTLEFLGEWETIYNPGFNSLRFQEIRKEAGTVRFTMSVKEWIEETGAIGLDSRAGRYGGTFAHRDIAFEFGTRISARFKILLIKEFQRLKSEEYNRQQLEWDYGRFLTKVNYQLHTETIRDHILPRLQIPKKPGMDCLCRRTGII